MHKESKGVPEKGLLNLINQKLEAGNTKESIEVMLLRAGLDWQTVQDAIQYATRNETSLHQREIEENDFLPPLNKNRASIHTDTHAHTYTHAQARAQNNWGNPRNQSDYSNHSNHRNHESITLSIEKVIEEEIDHKGLFSGRLRRKDFIIGILFFFGLGFILANVIVTWVQFFYPDFARLLANMILDDQSGMWLLFVPIVFAPITLMILSLITRRLHNLGFPGWIAPLYLIAFVSPFGALGGYLLLAFHSMLLVLFVVMLTVKGHPKPNKHGALPPSTGSIFGRVFGR